MSNKGKKKGGKSQNKKNLPRYQSSCADVAPLGHFEKSLIEFHVRVRFIVCSSEGLGFRLGAGRFLSLAVSGETAGVQPRSAAGACVCGAACAKITVRDG